MASILMVAGEGLPFIKTGGLADVIGSLPAALTQQGHEVKVVMPLYRKIAEKYMDELYFDCEFSVSIAYHEVPVRVYSKMEGDVCFFFIQHQGYFERDTLYGYDDDGERFAYFQNIFLPNGISHFKLEGRSLGSAIVLEFLLYYMTRPEYQLKVREEIYLDSMLDLF